MFTQCHAEILQASGKRLRRNFPVLSVVDVVFGIEISDVFYEFCGVILDSVGCVVLQIQILPIKSKLASGKKANPIKQTKRIVWSCSVEVLGAERGCSRSIGIYIPQKIINVIVEIGEVVLAKFIRRKKCNSPICQQ